MQCNRYLLLFFPHVKLNRKNRDRIWNFQRELSEQDKNKSHFIALEITKIMDTKQFGVRYNIPTNPNGSLYKYTLFDTIFHMASMMHYFTSMLLIQPLVYELYMKCYSQSITICKILHSSNS